MSRKPIFSLVAGAFALATAASAAIASPINSGASLAKAGTHSLAEPVRFGGGGGGHVGGFGGAGFHAGGFSGGHFAGHSQFHGQALARSNLSRGHHFDHGRDGHHRHRFFVGGYPYFYYDDGYYDDDYGDDCWRSRRYHRWVCSDY